MMHGLIVGLVIIFNQCCFAFYARPDYKKSVLLMFNEDSNQLKSSKFRVVSPTEVDSLFNVKFNNIQLPQSNLKNLKTINKPVSNISNTTTESEEDEELEYNTDDSDDYKMNIIQKVDEDRNDDIIPTDSITALKERAKRNNVLSTSKNNRVVIVQNRKLYEDTDTSAKLQKMKADLKAKETIKQIKEVQDSYIQFITSVKKENTTTKTRTKDATDDLVKAQLERRNQRKASLSKIDLVAMKMLITNTASSPVNNHAFDTTPTKNEEKLINALLSLKPKSTPTTPPTTTTKKVRSVSYIKTSETNKNRRDITYYPIQYPAFRLAMNLPANMNDSTVQALIDSGYFDREKIFARYSSRLDARLKKNKLKTKQDTFNTNRASASGGEYSNVDGYSREEEGYDSDGTYQGNYDNTFPNKDNKDQENKVKDRRKRYYEELDNEGSLLKAPPPPGTPSKGSKVAGARVSRALSVEDINNIYDVNQQNKQPTSSTTNPNNIINSITTMVNSIIPTTTRKSAVDIINGREKQQKQRQQIKSFTNNIINQDAKFWFSVIVSVGFVVAIVQTSSSMSTVDISNTVTTTFNNLNTLFDGDTSSTGLIDGAQDTMESILNFSPNNDNTINTNEISM